MQCLQEKPSGRDREVSGDVGRLGVQVWLQRQLPAQDTERRPQEPDTSIRGMHGSLSRSKPPQPAAREVKRPFAATVWTDEMISILTEMKQAGYSYKECGKAIGLSHQTVANKVKELGLPRKSACGWGAVYLRAPEIEPSPRSKVASIISKLGVGEDYDFPRPNPAEGKRIHKLVSKYGTLSGKGFRGRVDIIRGILRVTRIR